MVPYIFQFGYTILKFFYKWSGLQVVVPIVYQIVHTILMVPVVAAIWLIENSYKILEITEEPSVEEVEKCQDVSPIVQTLASPFRSLTTAPLIFNYSVSALALIIIATISYWWVGCKKPMQIGIRLGKGDAEETVEESEMASGCESEASDLESEQPNSDQCDLVKWPVHHPWDCEAETEEDMKSFPDLNKP